MSLMQRPTGYASIAWLTSFHSVALIVVAVAAVALIVVALVVVVVVAAAAVAAVAAVVVALGSSEVGAYAVDEEVVVVVVVVDVVAAAAKISPMLMLAATTCLGLAKMVTGVEPIGTGFVENIDLTFGWMSFRMALVGIGPGFAGTIVDDWKVDILLGDSVVAGVVAAFAGVDGVGGDAGAADVHDVVLGQNLN